MPGGGRNWKPMPGIIWPASMPGGSAIAAGGVAICTDIGVAPAACCCCCCCCCCWDVDASCPPAGDTMGVPRVGVEEDLDERRGAGMAGCGYQAGRASRTNGLTWSLLHLDGLCGPFKIPTRFRGHLDCYKELRDAPMPPALSGLVEIRPSLQSKYALGIYPRDQDDKKYPVAMPKEAGARDESGATRPTEVNISAQVSVKIYPRVIGRECRAGDPSSDLPASACEINLEFIEMFPGSSKVPVFFTSVAVCMWPRTVFDGAYSRGPFALAAKTLAPLHLSWTWCRWRTPAGRRTSSPHPLYHDNRFLYNPYVAPW